MTDLDRDALIEQFKALRAGRKDGQIVQAKHWPLYAPDLVRELGGGSGYLARQRLAELQVEEIYREDVGAARASLGMDGFIGMIEERLGNFGATMERNSSWRTAHRASNRGFAHLADAIIEYGDRRGPLIIVELSDAPKPRTVLGEVFIFDYEVSQPYEIQVDLCDAVDGSRPWKRIEVGRTKDRVQRQHYLPLLDRGDGDDATGVVLSWDDDVRPDVSVRADVSDGFIWVDCEDDHARIYVYPDDEGSRPRNRYTDPSWVGGHHYFD